MDVDASFGLGIMEAVSFLFFNVKSTNTILQQVARDLGKEDLRDE